MVKLNKASEEYNIVISDFLDEVVTGRNEGAFKNFLKWFEKTWRIESVALSTKHSTGDILAVNALVPIKNFRYKKSFSYLYSSESDERSYIRKLRKKFIGELCSYCGSPGCGTLDHYYPKKLFPQFSIIPDNLVPCCYRCNKVKGEIFPITKDQRIIHPYFDDFLKNIIFEIEFKKLEGSIRFDIRPHSMLSPDQKAVVTYHIENLEIKKYHMRSILDGFEIIREDVLNWLDAGIPDATVLTVQKKTVAASIVKGKTADWTVMIRDSIVRIPANYNLIKNR